MPAARAGNPEGGAAAALRAQLVAEQPHHLLAEARPEGGRVEAQESPVEALVGRAERVHQPDSRAHGLAARTRASRWRTSAAATERPIEVSR